MQDKWKEIWNRRTHLLEEVTLDALIKADGFDGGAGQVDVDNWSNYIQDISKQIYLKDTDTIFEIGCGAGAFIYPFFLKGHTVGGTDYSKIMVNLAKEIMPGMAFESKDAVQFETSCKYDIVLSNSVFQYFDSFEYAKKVIRKMVSTSKRMVVILDINDVARKEEAMIIRRGQLSQIEYKEKYDGLSHLFYDKKWFKAIAEECNCNIEIHNQDINGYLNSKFRFNVFLTK